MLESIYWFIDVKILTEFKNIESIYCNNILQYLHKREKYSKYWQYIGPKNHSKYWWFNNQYLRAFRKCLVNRNLGACTSKGMWQPRTWSTIARSVTVISSTGCISACIILVSKSIDDAVLTLIDKHRELVFPKDGITNHRVHDHRTSTGKYTMACTLKLPSAGSAAMAALAESVGQSWEMRLYERCENVAKELISSDGD